MIKEIIVRKNRTQRLGILIVFLLMVSFSIYISILFYPVYYFGLLSIIGTLPVLCIFLYYDTWQISFSTKSITVKSLFRKTQSYTYHQISDGYIADSYTLYQYVSLSFMDKRKLRFRMEDENASKAVQIIQAHRSLRRLN